MGLWEFVKSWLLAVGGDVGRTPISSAASATSECQSYVVKEMADLSAKLGEIDFMQTFDGSFIYFRAE